MTTVTATTKYSLRKIKTFRGMDGEGLNAELLRDGKPVAFILDEGCGGEMSFQFFDQMHGKTAEGDLWDAFIAAEKSKLDDVKKDEYGITAAGYMDGAAWVDTKVDDLLTEKKFRRLCKTKTLFQVGAEIGGDEFRTMKGTGPVLHAFIEKKYAGQKFRILNDEFKD
jgi:hypothetical protein